MKNTPRVRTGGPSARTPPAPSAIPAPAANPPHQADWRYDLSAKIALSDALILAATTAAAVVLRFGFNANAQAKGVSISYNAFAIGVAVAWWIALAIFRTRDPRILGDGALEYRRVGRATTIMFGVLAIAAVLLKWDLSRGFLAISLPLGLISLILSRRGWRIWLCHQRKRGHSVSRALVVGGPRAAVRLAETFNSNPALGLVVAGAWVPDAGRGSAQELDAEGNVPLLGQDHDVLSALSLVHADTVIVTDSEHFGPEGMRELTWQLVGVDIDLMVSPNLVDITAQRMHLGHIGSEPFIHVDQPKHLDAGTALKGIFDITLGSVLTVIAVPILFTAALAVKLTSPGPAFFVQERIGRGGQTFKIIKIRTMVEHAASQHEELAHVAGQADAGMFKLQEDPRITPVGHFLRRFSIDELPQLINVIKGDMSLVGPRPPLPNEVSNYDQREMRRLAVRPGMTGLWQVSGRSDLDWSDTVRLDLHYVENWSMTTDLMILWRTIRAVVGSRGAY